MIFNVIRISLDNEPGANDNQWTVTAVKSEETFGFAKANSNFWESINNTGKLKYSWIYTSSSATEMIDYSLSLCSFPAELVDAHLNPTNQRQAFEFHSEAMKSRQWQWNTRDQNSVRLHFQAEF